MIRHVNLKKPDFLIGLLFTLFFIHTGCNQDLVKKVPDDDGLMERKLIYLAPIDSVDFMYTSPSWKKNSNNYLENRFGQNLYPETGKHFIYTSINSNTELHTFNSKTNEHTYTKPICAGEIDAFKIDASLIYLLYQGMFYVKDHKLNTLDSFVYMPPAFNQKHAVDFDIENTSNLFKIKNYFVLLYYIVDEKPDNMNIYKNTDPLFYFFNRDTAFFADKQCPELSTSFQYFRYPAVASDNEYLYHAPRVMNCISMSAENNNVAHVSIDKLKNNYLAIQPNDQYEISKLKKYRFSSEYNRNIVLSNDGVYLIKDIPGKIYYKDNVRTYETVLEVKKFNKQLDLIKTIYIRDNSYSYAFSEGNRLLLFKLFKNKYFIYEI